jgi:hypothetical protein
MPELDTEPDAELLTPVAETVPETATPLPAGTVRDTPGEVGSRLGETMALDGGLIPPPELAAALIGHPAYAMTANAPQKARLLLDLQRRYGNAYIQEVMTLVRPQHPASPAPAPAATAPDSAAEAPSPRPAATPPPTSEPSAMATTVEIVPPSPAVEPSAPEVTPPQATMPVIPQAPVTPEVTLPPPATMLAAPETTAAPSALTPAIPLAVPVVPEVGMPEAEVAAAREEEVEAPEAAAPASGAMEVNPEAAAEAGAETEPTVALAPETAAEEKAAAGAPEAAEAVPQAADKAPASPQEDPAFQAMVQRSQGVAMAQRSHAPAASKAAAAQAAAAGPANEVASSAAGAQVGKMDAQEPRQFDRAAFKAALLQKIAQTTPSTLKEADEFKESGKLDTVKRDMTSKVAEGKAQAQGNIAVTAQETPDTTGITPKPVTPLAPPDVGPPPADIGATAAAPKPKTEAEVSLQEGNDTLEQQMRDNEITEPQLAQSGEPAFQAALTSKKTAQTHAQEAPRAYRQQEQGIVAGAQVTAETAAQVQLDVMHGQRASVLAQVATAQVATRGVDEHKRAEVAKHIDEIYQHTKANVEARLQSLDDAVNQAFDTGSAQAQQAFEAHVERRMEDYKDERYSGVRGKYRWVRDKFAGLPDEVNVFYEEGRKLYLSIMDGVLDNIAIIVETGLNDAKAAIALGKQAVQNYVASLPIDLQEVGQQAAGEIQTKFADLEQQVNDKQGELVDSLARKYQENLQKLDARIAEMKAANRGLIAAAFDAIAGVIKTIIQLKNMLLNVLARAVSVIGTIISDPIGFLGNLVSGVMQGLRNFMANLAQHLKKGLMDWLFGALAGAGIQMPESFDVKGILSLVLQVLGLTYVNIRARAVHIVGEPIVARLEQAAEIFTIMITEGPAGLWNWIKEKVGDLKAMVLDGIQNFVMEKVIIAGITWIISLLNPASAFIKACKAIYDIVMFFVQRGSQIIELVNAVLDSIAAIAQGALGAAANAVENALAKAIPVVIGFLASLLGLGGMSDKIRAIIDKIRAPINAAIDWVINKAVQLVKAAGKLFGFGRDKEGIGDGGQSERHGRAVYDGQIGKVVTFAGKNEAHRVWIELQGGNPMLVVASAKQSLLQFLGSGSVQAAFPNAEEYNNVVQRAITQAKQIELDAETVYQLIQEATAPQAPPATEATDAVEQQDSEVETQEEHLAALLAQIFKRLGVGSGDQALLELRVRVDRLRERVRRVLSRVLAPDSRLRHREHEVKAIMKEADGFAAFLDDPTFLQQLIPDIVKQEQDLNEIEAQLPAVQTAEAAETPAETGTEATKHAGRIRAVQTAVPHARLVDPETELTIAEASAVQIAQEFMNDLNHSTSIYGDKSTAFIVLMEAVAGRPISGDTLHEIKSAEALPHLRNLRNDPNLPAAARTRLDTEIAKLNDALAFLAQRRAGGNPSLPRWATRWANQINDVEP